jgi:hypothetical protein
MPCVSLRSCYSDPCPTPAPARSPCDGRCRCRLRADVAPLLRLNCQLGVGGRKIERETEAAARGPGGFASKANGRQGSA